MCRTLFLYYFKLLQAFLLLFIINIVKYMFTKYCTSICLPTISADHNTRPQRPITSCQQTGMACHQCQSHSDGWWRVKRKESWHFSRTWQIVTAPYQQHSVSVGVKPASCWPELPTGMLTASLISWCQCCLWVVTREDFKIIHRHCPLSTYLKAHKTCTQGSMYWGKYVAQWHCKNVSLISNLALILAIVMSEIKFSLWS